MENANLYCRICSHGEASCSRYVYSFLSELEYSFHFPKPAEEFLEHDSSGSLNRDTKHVQIGSTKHKSHEREAPHFTQAFFKMKNC